MKQITLILISLLLFGLCCTSCNNYNDKCQKWYDTTKAAILKQSDLKADSVIVIPNEKDSSFKYEHSFFHGHEFLLRDIGNGILRYEVHYSTDSRFELRREFCRDGNFGFEGITYLKEFYGLSTWRYCGGHVQTQGLRFKNDHIGDWKDWDENNKLTITHYKRYSAIDSMPTINTQ